MAIQSIPLANSLYLAMLSQERQDHSRRIQKEEADMLRRDNNMRDTQNYILKIQDQKMQHERDREDMALKRRAQLMQERIEQAGMMERRQAQDKSAMLRTLVGERGKGIDRQQRADAALATEHYRDRSLAERRAGRQQRGASQELYRAERIALGAGKVLVDQKMKLMQSLATQIKALTGHSNRAARQALRKKYEDAHGEWKTAMDAHQARQVSFEIAEGASTAPPPGGVSAGTGGMGDGEVDPLTQSIMDSM